MFLNFFWRIHARDVHDLQQQFTVALALWVSIYIYLYFFVVSNFVFEGRTLGQIATVPGHRLPYT